MRNRLLLLIPILALLLAGREIVQAVPLFVANIQSASTTPGTLQSYVTADSIGFEWPITGDSNHDAAVSVQYRVQGSSSWQPALPLFRVDYNSFNMLAGSILFLDPGVTYDVQLVLTDPDGGSSNQTLAITTRSLPVLPDGGRTLHVVPGSGGGDGSEANPFQGMSVAQAAAQPGDIFLIHAGSYPGEVLFNVSGTAVSYIVWKAAGDGDAIFDNLRIDADYIWLEGLNVDPVGDYGLRTYNSPQNVVINRNTFINCHYCIYLNHGGDNWTITDNIIIGDTLPASGSFDGEGIELNHTSGHTVAYNRISYVADGISYPDHNVDIFGNDIFDVSDDGIEPDYGYANVRIWNNRISGAYHNGISFQPMNGAPWYVIRNQVAAPAENALKLRDGVDRVLLAHNTLIAWQGPQTVQTDWLLSMQSNNNLWISVTDWYAWENGTGSTPNWRTNLDYDGFDWGNNVYAFKWGNRYPDLPSFQAATGLETHAIHVDKDTCFETFNVPSPPPASVPRQFMTLRADCNAVDAGIPLANINDDYLGSAPDLGAYEVGAELPQYGPRDATPLVLTGSPADRTIYLSWKVNITLPVTATWQISYDGPVGSPPSPIVGISNATRNYTITNLTNYTLYTVTLHAILDSSPILTGTVAVMPTDLLVHLPVVMKQ